MRIHLIRRPNYDGPFTHIGLSLSLNLKELLDNYPLLVKFVLVNLLISTGVILHKILIPTQFRPAFTLCMLVSSHLV